MREPVGITLRPYQQDAITEAGSAVPPPAWAEFSVIRGQHPKNLSGQRFGKLEALYPVNVVGKRWKWLCWCDCGALTITQGSALSSNHSASCGCDQRSAAARVCADRSTHGRRNSRLYTIWRAMRSRCSNPNVINWHRYGGRGISVCAEWGRFDAFAAWADVSGYNDSLSIDRINNDGNYEPGNCRWATDAEQAANRCTSKRRKEV